MDAEKPQTTTARPQSKRRWRRAMVATTVVGSMVLSGLGLLPSAVMKSSHRDRLLNERVAKFGLTATSGSGSGGWLTAIAFHDVEFRNTDGQFVCKIKTLQLSKSLLSLLVSERDLGTLTVVQPDVYVRLNEDGSWPLDLKSHKPDDADADSEEAAREREKNRWDIAFDVQNAGFVLEVPWREMPIVEIAGVDVLGAVTTQEDGRWLNIEPIELFDRQPLSEAHTEQNLALVAPILSQTTSLRGEISARLDAISMRLDDDQSSPYPIRGQVALHNVEAELKKEWAIQVSQAIGQLTRRDVPSRLQIVQESTIDFEVNEQGIYHEGLAFLLPDVMGTTTVHSSGLVALDDSLDLTLSVQLPQMFTRNSFLSALTKMVSKPLVFRVEGTTENPKLVTPPGMGLTDQLAGNLDPQNAGTPPPSVQGAVMDLFGSAASPDGQQSADGIASGVLNIIRAAQEARKDEPANSSRPSREERREERKRRRQGI